MPKSLHRSRPWLRAFWQRAYRENVTGLSAMVAYNLMLAVFPFALLVLFVFGQVLKIGGVETSVINDLQRLFPSAEQHTLTDVLDRIEENSTTIGIAAFAGSLWIGASFWGAMDTAFCRIYHVECRGWVEQKRFSFAMLGVFFFLALYMQDILRYSPLEAGVRFLPSTLMIVGVAPVAGRLADRFGPRWLIVAGLALCAASLYVFSGIAVDSGYGDLLPGFMLLGIGIALTMSPMTSAAMNAVPVEKAGIASGVLSMFRMVGGSLGVAVTGAIFQGAVGESFANASPQEFVDALGLAMEVCGAVAAFGALLAAVTIRAHRDRLSVEATEALANPGGSELAAEEAMAPAR